MILVTGATGLVGSHLLYELALNNDIVIALKRVNSDVLFVKKVFSFYDNNYELLFNRIKWVEGDLEDYYSLEEALIGIDYVYNCAGLISFDKQDFNKLIDINYKGTANLINACISSGVKKLVHVSSIAALGRAKQNIETTEELQWEDSSNNSGYSISKHLAEMEVWRGSEEGLNICIINPSIIIGPGFWDYGSGRMIKIMWDGLKFYTKGTNGFVDVKDVAKSMIILMNSDINKQRYIINSENVDYKLFYELVSKYLNIAPPKYFANKCLSSIAWRFLKLFSLITCKKPLITKETARTANQTYKYNSNKFINEFDYKFISIEQSIKNTCELFLTDIKNKK